MAINWYSGYWLYAKSFLAGGPIKLGYVRGRTGLTPGQAGTIRRADELMGRANGRFFGLVRADEHLRRERMSFFQGRADEHRRRRANERLGGMGLRASPKPNAHLLNVVEADVFC